MKGYLIRLHYYGILYILLYTYTMPHEGHTGVGIPNAFWPSFGERFISSTTLST